jgi:phenylalanyl-tRNA synthetase beta chain
MKLPFSSILSWLPDWKLSPEQTAEILTSLGVEVESIDTFCPNFSRVIVAEVKSVEPHPSSDKLQVARVFDGSSEHTVVCGAKNCRPNLKVAYAQVGSTLTGKEGKEIEIKQADLRGVLSSGMLASEHELGLSDDHAGIWELHPHETTGIAIDKMFEETILHLALTPNLAHCQSAFGIACELAASQDMALPLQTEPEISQMKSPIHPKNEVGPSLCTRYSVACLPEVEDAPTPLWLRSKLNAYGIRSVSAIVDTIAYVMLEDGLPMHGFDQKLLEGDQLTCRDAASLDPSMRKIETLDGKVRELTACDLVICDKKKPVAIAGVMGGKATEVSANSTALIIEAAVFNPTSIRKTARRLNLRTEAAMRYERGCNPGKTLYSLHKVAEYLEKMHVSKQKASYSDTGLNLEPRIILFSPKRTNALLGLDLSQSEMSLYLKRLGFGVEEGEDDFKVTIPLSRMYDIKSPIDLVEEIARLHGLANFPDINPLSTPSELPNDPRYTLEKRIRSELIRCGLEEFMTCNLISEEMLQPWRGSFDSINFCRVNNPSIVQYSLLRPSHLPGLIASVKRNLGRGEKNIAAFEVGYVHMQEDDNSFTEPLMASIVLTGDRDAKHFSHDSAAYDFLDLKGIIESLFERLGIQKAVFNPSHLPAFHSHAQAEINIGACTLGQIGRCHPLIEKELGLSQPLFVAEINLNDAMQFETKKSRIHPICNFPSTTRDWTVTVKEGLSFAKLQETCHKAAPLWLQEIRLISIYHDESKDTKAQNFTLRFTYQSEDKTLTFEEVQEAHLKLINKALEQLDGLVEA